MSEALNIVKASFGGLREVATSPLWQWDYGQILKITGLDLPQAFEVHFSNSRKSGETVTQIGTDSQVTIPDMYLTSGADIYCFIFLHDGLTDGETEYVIKIPVRERPEPSDIEPTPEQQDAITEAIAALNVAVTQTAQDVVSADASARAASQSAGNAAESERQAGLSAQSADNSKTAAEQAQAKAEEAQGKAEDAQSAAELAQGKAEDAKQDSETAKREAEDAAGRAERAAASIVPVDPTLTVAGRAADAKSTGDRLDALTETVGGKQDTLTFDDAPTNGSVNPVKSGGVFNAVDTKVNKPLTNPMGTNGQLLRTLGNGQTEWTDQGLPTDEQTAQAVSDWLDNHPEATTTVQDGAITIPKFAQSTQDALIINSASDKAYYHNASPYKAEFYPNEYTQNITARYVGAENLFDYHYLSGEAGGVTRTPDGRFLKLKGTNTHTVTLSTMSGSASAEVRGKLAGKTVNVFVYLNKQSGWARNGNLYLTANSTNVINQRLKPDGTDVVGWMVFENIEMPQTLNNLVFKVDYIKDSIFEDGDFFWAGIFEATPTITDTVVTTDPVEVVINGVTKIDTMMHQSVVTSVIPTKQYVDEHVPDIKAYWTENIYALPEKFGAVGDGVEDDTQALVDCLAYSATSGKPVRGYGKYKTTSTIVLSDRYMDVYLREINYTGNESAVEFQNTDIVFGFHRILSNNIGLSFYRSSRNAMRCQIKGNEISSIGHCIDIKNNTYYNTCDIRYLSSENGNCINRNYELLQSPGGEYVFRSSSCRCPNGWVSYNVTGSKFYDFTIEGNCKYGLLNPIDCVCTGFRHREQIDRMKLRIWGNASYNNGPLIKITNLTSAGCKFRYYLADGLYFFSIDLSDVQGYDPIPSGQGSTDNWQKLAYTGIDLGFYVRGADSESRHILGDKIYVIGGNIVLVPEGRKTAIIDIASVDFSLLESAVDEDIITANSIAKYLGTDFLLDVSHSDIYLNASFGAIGYSDITLTQADGNTATIYDKLGNVLFDGTNAGDGKWRFRCVMDRSSTGRFEYTSTSWWEYDGTNEIWEIEKIG